MFSHNPFQALKKDFRMNLVHHFDNNSFQEKNVKTTEPKHSNVYGIEELLKTDNTENGSDNTKEDDSENPKKKLKDISNRDKETYE